MMNSRLSYQASGREPKPIQPWHAQPIYSRDFAYANNGPVILLESMPTTRKNVADIAASEYAKLLSGPMVDVYIGQERRCWSLHVNLLRYQSSYVENELLEYKDSDAAHATITLEFPNEDPRGFELLVKWLYQGKLEAGLDSSPEQKYEYAVACHKLYQLCDKFGMIALKNLAMDCYRQNLHDVHLVPDAAEINEIYRASPPKSPFRRLMTQIAARQIMDPAVERNAESYRCCFEDNADFAVEMLNAIRLMSRGVLLEDPTQGDRCAWHDHQNGPPCSQNVIVSKHKECISDDSKERSPENGVNSTPLKITSRGVRRVQPLESPAKHETAQRRRTTSQEAPLESEITLSPSPHHTTESSSQNADVPSDTTATPMLPAVSRKRPRKLDRSLAKPLVTSGSIEGLPSVANESRKVTPKQNVPQTGHVGALQARPTTDGTRANVSRAPSKSTPNVRPPGSVNRLHGRNYVDGIVNQINN